MLKYEDIRIIRSEHTSRCNLRCPECARIRFGKMNKNLTLKDMTSGDYENILNENFRKQIEKVIISGCYGDPVASPTLMDSVKFLKSIGIKVEFQTNGSLRSSKWWREIAKILGESEEPTVSFAIDGIDHQTNVINRVCSNFNMIMRNAKAFIDAGGSARWDFIIFDYNKHQEKQARKMAKDMGFKSFVSRVSFNHVGNNHFIESFNENKYTGKNEHFKDLLKTYGSWKNYVEKTNVKCKIKEEKSIYIDHDLNLWPCCWLGGPYFIESSFHIQQEQLFELEKKYGKGFNSLKNKSVKEIFEHIWFKRDLEKSWFNSMNDKNPKLSHCVKICGDYYHPSTTEQCNRNLTIFER